MRPGCFTRSRPFFAPTGADCGPQKRFFERPIEFIYYYAEGCTGEAEQFDDMTMLCLEYRGA